LLFLASITPIIADVLDLNLQTWNTTMSKPPITGPVELVNNQFRLLIPLDLGGDELVPLTTRIATVEGDTLKVVIPDFMMKFLNLRAGALVTVDIIDGKFNIRSAEWNPGDPPGEMPPPGYVHLR
jgi:hypothetical protein